MSKRPSLIGGLSLPSNDETPHPAAAEPAAETSAPQSAAPALKAAAGRKPRPDVVHTSVYLPREVHRRLREIAFTRDVKVHDVIMEGIDAALEKHGHPPAARKPRRGE